MKKTAAEIRLWKFLSEETKERFTAISPGAAAWDPLENRSLASKRQAGRPSELAESLGSPRHTSFLAVPIRDYFDS